MTGPDRIEYHRMLYLAFPKKKKVSDQKHYQSKGRDRCLRQQYGITLEEYWKIYIEQGGRCAGCKRHATKFKRALHVDHCHSTHSENPRASVRGLLCWRCNSMLPNRQNLRAIVDNLAAYLKNPPATRILGTRNFILEKK